MKRAPFSASALALAPQPVAVEAQGVYNGNPAAFSQFQFAGIGTQTEGALGTRVGPYLGNFLDDTAGAFNIYCVDYLHWAMAPGRMLPGTRRSRRFMRQFGAQPLESPLGVERL